MSRLHIFAKHLSNHYDSYLRSSLTLAEAITQCNLLVFNSILKVYACSCRSLDSIVARLGRWWWWWGRKTPWNNSVIFFPSLSLCCFTTLIDDDERYVMITQGANEETVQPCQSHFLKNRLPGDDEKQRQREKERCQSSASVDDMSSKQTLDLDREQHCMTDGIRAGRFSNKNELSNIIWSMSWMSQQSLDEGFSSPVEQRLGSFSLSVPIPGSKGEVWSILSALHRYERRNRCTRQRHHELICCIILDRHYFILYASTIFSDTKHHLDPKPSVQSWVMILFQSFDLHQHTTM